MDNPWLDIRNSAGHMLFQYNPFTNEVQFRKGGYTYDVIRLDEIRAKFDVIDVVEPATSFIVVIQEKKNGHQS